MEITPRDAAALLDGARGRALLLDCRTPEEHATARIEGAVLIPMQELEQRLGEIEGRQDDPLVVHCHHGVRSLRVTAFLRQCGFEHAVSMSGGIDQWSLDVDPRVPRY
ncbi:MAG: rhodanese-like domain-containing protein [Phycisphaerales bacterium]